MNTRNYDSPTKQNVETFDAIACAILAICYRHARKRLRSNSTTYKFHPCYIYCQISLFYLQISCHASMFQYLQIPPCYVYCQIPLLEKFTEHP